VVDDAPRTLLLILSPIVVVVLVLTVVVFLARRVWRYPVFLIGATVLVGVGLGSSWWACAKLVTGLAVLGGVWAWQHPDSFTRTVLRQVRSKWRRVVIYA
jgi:hypothetical protein